MPAPSSEIWFDINKRYQVSSKGRVRSVDFGDTDSRGRPRLKKGKILSPGYRIGITLQ